MQGQEQEQQAAGGRGLGQGQGGSEGHLLFGLPEEPMSESRLQVRPQKHLRGEGVSAHRQAAATQGQ